MVSVISHSLSPPEQMKPMGHQNATKTLLNVWFPQPLLLQALNFSVTVTILWPVMRCHSYLRDVLLQLSCSSEPTKLCSTSLRAHRASERLFPTLPFPWHSLLPYSLPRVRPKAADCSMESRRFSSVPAFQVTVNCEHSSWRAFGVWNIEIWLELFQDP